jgi:hypothetical protein
METFTDVLNKNLNVHLNPSEEQFQLTIDDLHRLIDELERPQNRELMRFVFAWQKLEQELDKLQRNIQERMAERPTNKLDEFLKKLIKKN